MRGATRCQRGAASAEHAGLVLLVAVLAAAAVAALAAAPPAERTPELATAIARKLRCGPRLPGPCWRDPLTEAYGRSLAGAVRALAPEPIALAGPGGEPLLPVDFRVCRTPSCAAPGPRPELTASNRRVTVFVSARRTPAGAEIAYWEYRPGLGWRERRRVAGAGELAELVATPLPEDAHPRLVPLETLPGRNHVRFAPGEEPPWRWRVESVVPGG